MLNENYGAETFAGKTSHLNIRVSIPATPLQIVELLVSYFSLGIYEVFSNILKEKNSRYSASKSLFIACQ